MGKPLKLTLLSIGLLGAALLLQSTVLRFVAIGGVKPDLSLIILIFIASRTGSMIGQISGFAAGMLQDLISYPPLGFYALIRTIIGAIYGKLQGAFIVDSLFVPILLALAATLMKGILIWLLALIFSVSAPNMPLLGAKFWIEAGYNAVLTPFVFALLNMIKLYKISKKEIA